MRRRLYPHDDPSDVFLGTATEKEADRYFNGLRGDWYITSRSVPREPLNPSDRGRTRMVIYRFGPDKYSYTCGYLSVWLNRPLFRERWEALPVEVRESTERGYREALEKIAAFTLDGELDREMGSEDAYVIANEAIKIARAAIEAEDRKSASD